MDLPIKTNDIMLSLISLGFLLGKFHLPLLCEKQSADSAPQINSLKPDLSADASSGDEVFTFHSTLSTRASILVFPAFLSCEMSPTPSVLVRVLQRNRMYRMGICK